MRKLEIGAGNSRLEPDWETSDIRPLPGIDHVCDATQIHTLGGFDRLYASHVLEHLGQIEHMEALKSWYKALNFGGILEIVVPDMEYIAEGILNGKVEEFIYLAFGDSDDCVEMLHKWGFTQRTLANKLKEAGFYKPVVNRQNNILYAKVVK